MRNIGSECVKPFLKWAGGKRQLLNEISKYYPFNQKINKYIEPFVGGGAVLFDILNKFDLNEIYINDINRNLINTYCVIQNNVDVLIDRLNVLQSEFLSLSIQDRKKYYYQKRDNFNRLEFNGQKDVEIEKAALMIFLNKTCFNGLYRVNKKGSFNVPMGAYKTPLICDENNLNAVSDKLKNVTIYCGDYRDLLDLIYKDTFVYIDPPYRPLTNTANFTAYTENSFDDNSQEKLARFVYELDKRGTKVLISNSDTKDGYFNELYKDFKIESVNANRMISCNSNGRCSVNELLISNF